jgi:outer membrane protein OmpA-like peptidoglycan-associated protein
MATPAAAHRTTKPPAVSPQRSAATRAPRNAAPARLAISHVQQAAGNRTIHRLLRNGGPSQSAPLSIQRLCPDCEKHAPQETDREGPTSEDEVILQARRATGDLPEVSSGPVSIQRVADKSDVPPMDCTADPGPGAPVGTNVMFGQSDRALDSTDKGIIVAEHTAWLARGGIDTITIDGFASSEGAARDNWTLSCDRAKAVQAHFVTLGVPASMITTIAHGETEEFSTTSRTPNRRAVIRTVAGTAPSLIIFPIMFRASLNRVAPGRTVPVLILAAGLPAGRTIDLDIQGSGGANGTATVAPATIAGTAIVDVTGGTQTTPGSPGNLRLRARMGGLTLGTSAGFTVAAWPADFSVSLNADVNTATSLGLLANNAWDSDGTGGVAELDQVQRGEQIAAGHQDRPPFFFSLGPGSGLSPGNISPRVDTHTVPRSGVRTNAFLILAGTRFVDVTHQLFIFNDARTGVAGETAQNSGFTITDSVTFNAARSGWDHQTVKTGAATTIGARSSAAGAGTATSLVHPL